MAGLFHIFFVNHNSVDTSIVRLVYHNVICGEENKKQTFKLINNAEIILILVVYHNHSKDHSI